MEISDLRKLKDDSRIYEKRQGTLSETDEDTFFGRLWRYIVKWFGGSNTEDLARRDAKQMLSDALTRAEGGRRSSEAMRKVFGADWKVDGTTRLTGRTIHQVLDAANHMRMNCILRNRQLAKKFTSELGLRNTPAIRENKIGFEHYPRIKDRIMQSIMRHPDFYKRDLTEAKIEHLINEAIESYKQDVNKTFALRHPGLNKIADMLKIPGIRDEQMLTELSFALKDSKWGFGASFENEVRHFFETFKKTRELTDLPVFSLEKTSGAILEMLTHSKGTNFFKSDVQLRIEKLDYFKDRIPKRSRESLEMKVMEALEEELLHTMKVGKQRVDMLYQFLEANPTSERNINYALLMQDKCRLQALKNLINDLETKEVDEDQREDWHGQLDACRGLLTGETNKFSKAVKEYASVSNDINELEMQNQAKAKKDDIRQATEGVEAACRRFNERLFDLRIEKGVTVNDWKIPEITPEAMDRARIQAINGETTFEDANIPAWPTIDNLIVHKGVSYDQKLDPAINLRPDDPDENWLSYAARKLDEAGLKGLSAQTDPKDFRDIARTLQHSTLTGGDGPEPKVDMLRHAAISSRGQFLMVISTAMWTNPKLRNAILESLANTDPSRDDEQASIKFSFFNLNLMTPWPPDNRMVQELGLADRRAIQDRHFEILKALSKEKQPVYVPFIDRNGKLRRVPVDFRGAEVATPVNEALIERNDKKRNIWEALKEYVCKPTNKIWKHLEETNRTGLERLLGDLGNPKRGFAGSARGTPMGGMIGEMVTALDKELDNQKKAQNVLLGKLGPQLQEALTKEKDRDPKIDPLPDLERRSIRFEALEQWNELKNDFKKQLLGLKKDTKDLELQLTQEIPGERVPWLMREETRKEPEGSEEPLETFEKLCKMQDALLQVQDDQRDIAWNNLYAAENQWQAEKAGQEVKQSRLLKDNAELVEPKEGEKREHTVKTEPDTRHEAYVKGELARIEKRLGELRQWRLELDEQRLQLAQNMPLPPKGLLLRSPEGWDWHQKRTMQLQQELQLTPQQELKDLKELKSHNRNIERLGELRHNLQEAVDIVRDIYCSGRYKINDGNRYQFALAVMFVTVLTKQLSEELNKYASTENLIGFGASQGSMNNQDRAGYLDAMVKSLAISPDNAFKLLRFNPDSHAKLSPYELASMIEPLPPKDAANLLAIGLLYTGQLQDWQAKGIIMRSGRTDLLMAAIEQYHPDAYDLLKGPPKFPENAVTIR